MPIKTIVVPQDFQTALHNFASQMKDLLDKTDKIAKQMAQAQVQQPVQIQAQHQSQFIGAFRRLEQWLGKVENTVQARPSVFSSTCRSFVAS